MVAEPGTQHETTPEFPPLGRNIKALLVWPTIPNSFWTFAGMIELLPEKVVMPPLGLVTVAGLCPSNWTLRLLDQAVGLACRGDAAAVAGRAYGGGAERIVRCGFE